MKINNDRKSKEIKYSKVFMIVKWTSWDKNFFRNIKFNLINLQLPRKCFKRILWRYQIMEISHLS